MKWIENRFDHELVLQVVLDGIDSWIDSMRKQSTWIDSWIESKMNKCMKWFEKTNLELIHKLGIDSWINWSSLYHITFKNGDYLRVLKNCKSIHELIHVS